MMTKETMTLIEETQKFNKAVDLFFGMNPEKRLWILLMLYLGKEKSLRFVDNVSPIRRKMISRKLQAISKGAVQTRYKSKR
jgi:hypothetical protein